MNRYVAGRSTTPPPPYINQNPPNSDTVMPLSVNNFTNETQSYSGEQAQVQGQHAPPSYQTVQNPLNNHIVDPVNVIILPTMPTQALNKNYNQVAPRSYLIWSVVSIVGSLFASTACLCLLVSHFYFLLMFIVSELLYFCSF